MTSTLLVATHGGHFSELAGFRDRIENVGRCTWITNSHPQTVDALEDERSEFVPFIESRDLLGIVKALPHAARTLRRGGFDRVVSTGSGIALAWLPLAALFGIASHYIESSTRLAEPSLTGRILRRVPGVTTWWQYDESPRGWRSVPGLYSHFWAAPAECSAVTSIVVTVGTTDLPFRRLVDRLIEILPTDVDVFWQVGATDTSDLDIDAHKIVDGDELRRRIAKADVVVSHAGAGSLLLCLEAGRIPVFVPRLAEYGEQIDDHQVELAQWTDELGLGVVIDASSVDWDDIVLAAGQQAMTDPLPTIRLDRP